MYSGGRNHILLAPGAERACAKSRGASGAGRKVFYFFGCNPLKSPDFGRIKPSKSKQIQGFLFAIHLDLLGLAWKEFARGSAEWPDLATAPVPRPRIWTISRRRRRQVDGEGRRNRDEREDDEGGHRARRNCGLFLGDAGSDRVRGERSTGSIASSTKAMARAVGRRCRQRRPAAKTIAVRPPLCHERASPITRRLGMRCLS